MILAPTLSLSAGSGAAIARPTFSRDFAGEKTLNNGTGPAITFTRASNATFFDANGTLQTAANDTPRFDHDPATGASRGLLIEEARTNSIRNSQAGGAAAGVLFSGSGVVPTNWGISNKSTDGVTTEITSVGTESGIAYFDLKISGTPTATSAVYIAPEPRSQVVASSGQTWTSSVYLKIVAGALTNLTRWHIIEEGDSSGNYLIGGQVTLTPTSSSLNTQRYSFTRTLTNASAARVRGLISIEYTNGQQIGGSVNGLTLRIAAPQLEQGAFPTSYIPTTTAAATRAADSAVVTPISSFYNQAEGTFVTDTNKSPLSGSFPTIWHLTNGTNDTGNVIGFYNPSNSTISYDASPAFSFAESVSAGIAKSGFAFSASSSRMAVNGVLEPASDQAATITTDKASLRLGAKRNGSEPLNGHIRKIAYWPRRLSNTLLQQLTT
jgi:hypothetical protein